MHQNINYQFPYPTQLFNANCIHANMKSISDSISFLSRAVRGLEQGDMDVQSSRDGLGDILEVISESANYTAQNYIQESRVEAPGLVGVENAKHA
ncbi:hypothetical protein N473_12910 [Pseudoalteromonas luteoviolacea CPMOR-1]|uniref:Uncharacterized protein n=1 Tax=Pseudoalteromonas luteoviolacea CPMOR-1 TaxID=1365248 RepID=A0A167LNU2_9GAMM|nr:hypothetical protein [Pseudoalteromonas luteoviolacea]KZN64932.1 hypothetical protein N473_12910 [Pseudoalteromonas luteoviolacea CPMOR-1]